MVPKGILYANENYLIIIYGSWKVWNERIFLRLFRKGNVQLVRSLCTFTKSWIFIRTFVNGTMSVWLLVLLRNVSFLFYFYFFFFCFNRYKITTVIIQRRFIYFFNNYEATVDARTCIGYNVMQRLARNIRLVVFLFRTQKRENYINLLAVLFHRLIYS